MNRELVFRVVRNALAAVGFVAVAWFVVGVMQAYLWIFAILIGAAEAILLLRVEKMRMAILLNIFNVVDFVWRLLESEETKP